jgi:hypothetical protein
MLLKDSRLSCASMASGCYLRSVYAAVLSRFKAQPSHWPVLVGFTLWLVLHFTPMQAAP